MSAYRVPTRRMPDLVIGLIALFDLQMRDLVPLLGWKPRSWEDAVTATAESLFDLGLVDAK
jgi:dihydroflavonol-4-reductase